ncbi:MAG: hypothetical protein CVV49_07225 [Spirochaetae bacterium HGW-Spirochaetae-5]|nr:MAG: hypothetical protein CVV49_07225 [Spirochaetae bacterium HGW-Spirochaetae-5]
MGTVKRKIIILAILTAALSAVGCADFDLHVKEETRGLKPAVILIGHFEIRNMNYDPYVSEEFRDALKYAFFRRGYNSVSLKNTDLSDLTETECAAKTCADNNGDILVTGVISQRESGFLADRKTNTLITFTIYNKTGTVAGKGFYHVDQSAGDETVRRDAADKFVSELLDTFERVK